MTPIVRALSEIQWNLSFNKTTMETAIKRLCECADWSVQIPTEERQKFAAKKGYRTPQEPAYNPAGASKDSERQMVKVFSRMGRSSQPCS